MFLWQHLQGIIPSTRRSDSTTDAVFEKHNVRQITNKCPRPGCETRCSRHEDLWHHLQSHLCPTCRHTTSGTSGPVQQTDTNTNPPGFPLLKPANGVSPASLSDTRIGHRLSMDDDTGVTRSKCEGDSGKPTDAKGAEWSALPGNTDIDITNPSFVGHYSQIHHQDSGPSPNNFAPDSHTPIASAPRCPSSNGSGTQCNPSPRGDPPDPATLSHSKPLPYLAHICGCTGLAATQAQGILVVTPSQLQSKHLRDDLLRISGTPHLKAQALGLRGAEAACFNQSIHHCLTDLPKGDPAQAPILRLLQDICSESGELPASYWLQRVAVNRRQCIGRGGEALIFPAFLPDRKVVARQVLEPDGRGWGSQVGQEALQHIRREIITHAQLRHPNVIEFLGVFREDENEAAPLIILPFLEKGSALCYLNQLSAKELLTRTSSILLDVASALAYLHSKEPPVYHGDVHPDNILIGAKGNAVLCDFGFSRIRHEITRTRTLIRGGGHLRYLAPELLLHSHKFRTTQASDIYSLGMTFLTLVTLELPFAGLGHEYEAKRAAEQRIRPERPQKMNLASTAENPMWILLETMWRHEPEKRPGTLGVNDRLNEIFLCRSLRSGSGFA